MVFTCTAASMMFERLAAQVSVRTLGGLMALGYEIGTMMKRTSVVYSDERLTIKLDEIEGMDPTFVQIQVCCLPAWSA